MSPYEKPLRGKNRIITDNLITDLSWRFSRRISGIYEVFAIDFWSFVMLGSRGRLKIKGEEQPRLLFRYRFSPALSDVMVGI